MFCQTERPVSGALCLKEYKLALNRAHHNAGNEVPLQQGIDQQQRDNCNNDLGCIEVGVAHDKILHDVQSDFPEFVFCLLHPGYKKQILFQFVYVSF